MKHVLSLLLFALALPGQGAETTDAVVKVGGCSGVCVDPAGIVLTAKHCHLDETETVHFPDRSPVEASRVWIGPDAEDVVAYHCAGDDWPHVDVVESVAESGSEVWSAEYPTVMDEGLDGVGEGYGRGDEAGDGTLGESGVRHVDRERVWDWKRVFELAALAGVEPWRYTLRELDWMATERLGQAWQHTSLLAAVIANCHRNPRRRAFEPAEFNPVEIARRRRLVRRHRSPCCGISSSTDVSPVDSETNWLVRIQRVARPEPL